MTDVGQVTTEHCGTAPFNRSRAIKFRKLVQSFANIIMTAER